MAHRKITILAITKYEGAGAATIARQLVKDYHYIHYSVRKYITDIFEKKHKRLPEHQEELEEFATNLCKKSISAVIAPIIKNIIEDTRGELFVVESILRPGEIEYLINTCKRNKIKLKFIKLDASAKTRLARIRKERLFKGERTIEKLKSIYMPAIVEHLNAVRWFEEFDHNPEKVNLHVCFSKLPDEVLFQNPNGKKKQTAEQIHQYVLSD